MQFDVRSRSANSVFRYLQSYRHDGSTVAVDYIDATLGEGATEAPEHFLVVRAENLCHQAILMNHATGAVTPEDADVI